MDETIFETEVVTDVNAIDEEVTTKATTEESSTLDLDTYYLSYYNEQYPRPSQLIIIDLGIDPDWKAFLEEPAFPDWISGHSTIAYAVEVVFTEQFGDIDIFDVISHGTSSIEREYDGDDLGINPDRIAFLEEPGFPDWISGHSTMA